MSSLSGITALHKALLAHHVERRAAQPGILAHGFQILAILHSDAARRRLHDDTRTRQMSEVDQSHPAVTGIFHRDACPTMVLVMHISGIKARFERHILDAGFANLPLVVHKPYIARAEGDMLVYIFLVVDIRCLFVGVKTHRKRSIELQDISLGSNYGSTPMEVDVSWFPSQGIDAAPIDPTTHRFNPGGRTLPHDLHFPAY